MLVGSESGKNAFGRFSCAAVRRGKKVEGVVGAKEGAQSSPSFVGLSPAVLSELYSVVGDGLVDVSVF